MQTCYIYYSVSNNDYLLSLNPETESKSVNVVIDNKVETNILYYAKINHLEGFDSIAYVSNNKKLVCEYIYDLFDLGCDDNTIYYNSGEVFKCNFKCTMKSKKDAINCIMKHNIDEYKIMKLNNI